MKLSECCYGKLVCTLDQEGHIEYIGIVVGITNNRDSCAKSDKCGEDFAVPLVKFSCEVSPRGVHSNHLVDYKKYCRGF